MKQKVDKEKRVVIDEEVSKLFGTRFITEKIPYLASQHDSGKESKKRMTHVCGLH